MKKGMESSVSAGTGKPFIPDSIDMLVDAYADNVVLSQLVLRVLLSGGILTHVVREVHDNHLHVIFIFLCWVKSWFFELLHFLWCLDQSSFQETGINQSSSSGDWVEEEEVEKHSEDVVAFPGEEEEESVPNQCWEGSEQSKDNPVS